MTSAPPARPSAGRQLLTAVVTLLVVLFPALAAGACIDAPAAPAELARLAAAQDDPRGESGGPASLLYRMLVPDDATTSEEIAAALPLARLATVLGVFAISGMLYLSVTLARGRAVAALACLAFGALPPTAVEGAFLRPEVPSTVFAMLGVLVLVGLPVRLREVRRQRLHGWLTVIAIAFVVATAFGLAVATLPAWKAWLLIPAACLAAAVAVHLWTLTRVLGRFRLRVLPFYASALRLLPWAMLAFLTILMTLLVMRVAHGPQVTSVSAVGLLPRSPWLRLPLVLLAGVGGVLTVLRTGLELGRRRRLTPSVVLALAALPPLARVLTDHPDADQFAGAPAFALLVAEGAAIALLFAGGLLGRTGRPLTSAS